MSASGVQSDLAAVVGILLPAGHGAGAVLLDGDRVLEHVGVGFHLLDADIIQMEGRIDLSGVVDSCPRRRRGYRGSRSR